MKAGKLKEKLSKTPDGCDVVVEVEKGRKYEVLYAKKQNLNAGHKFREALMIVCKV